MSLRRMNYVALLSTTLLVGFSGMASAEGFVFRDPPVFSCPVQSIITTHGEVLSPEKQAQIKCLDDYRAAMSQFTKEQTVAYEEYKKTLPAGPFVIGGSAVTSVPVVQTHVSPAGSNSDPLLKACQLSMNPSSERTTGAPTGTGNFVAALGGETQEQAIARQAAQEAAAAARGPLPDVSHYHIPRHPADFMEDYGLFANGVGVWAYKSAGGISYDLTPEQEALVLRYKELTRGYSGTTIEQTKRQNSGVKESVVGPTSAAPTGTGNFVAALGGETQEQAIARQAAQEAAAAARGPLPDVSHYPIPLHPADFAADYGLASNGVGVWGYKSAGGVSYDLTPEQEALVLRYKELTRGYSGATIGQTKRP